MALAERTASVAWTGDVKRGSGKVSLDSSGAGGELGISLPTRTGEAEANGGTSPEELLAAAHAGCYAMALSLVLTQAGTPPERLDASAECTLERAGEGLAVTTMKLTVRGQVPDADDDGFQSAARTAEEHCPISNALRGNVEIELDAALA